MFAFTTIRPWLRRPLPSPPTRRIRFIALTFASVGALALTPTIHLDAYPQPESTGLAQTFQGMQELNVS